MNLTQLEAWVLAVVDRVRRGAPNEDARVELKAAWPDAKKVARRLAGHANAARGEDILWIMGINQETGEAKINAEELSTWFPQVVAQFDGLAPSMSDLVVPVENGEVVALLFETTRAPFVVKNSVQDGPVTLEVPWREGTRTRTATRADLIRLLAPIARLPKVEIITATAKAERKTVIGQKENQLLWTIELNLYIEPLNDSRIVIPRIKTRVRMEFNGYRRPSQINLRYLGPPRLSEEERHWSVHDEDYDLPDSHTIRASRYEVIVEGPGVLRIIAYDFLDDLDSVSRDPIRVGVRIAPAANDSVIDLETTLTPQTGLFLEEERWWWVKQTPQVEAERVPGSAKGLFVVPEDSDSPDEKAIG